MKFNLAYVLSLWTAGYSFGVHAGQKKAHSAIRINARRGLREVVK
jgi:hypothetical protein